MPWLSIIIPLYNCEPYITMCLNSVLQQGLEEDEYEVIVVNDGSTDDGAKIVAEYCKKHTNFHLINKENGGVSSARNRGMDEAQGEYVYFMDADDWLIPNGMRTLYDSYLTISRPDVIAFWSHIVDKHYDAEKREHIRPHKMLFSGTSQEYVRAHGFLRTVWVTILSREFLQQHDIRFEAFSYGEDTLFIITCLTIENSTIVATSLNIHRYYIREGSASTTRSAKRIEAKYHDIVGVCRMTEKLSHKSNYKKELFENVMNTWKVRFYLDLLYVAMPHKKKRVLLKLSREEKLFPIVFCETRWHKAINFLVKSPLATYILSLPTRYIFLPYIKPLMHRN